MCHKIRYWTVGSSYLKLNINAHKIYRHCYHFGICLFVWPDHSVIAHVYDLRINCSIFPTAILKITKIKVALVHLCAFTALDGFRPRNNVLLVCPKQKFKNQLIGPKYLYDLPQKSKFTKNCITCPLTAWEFYDLALEVLSAGQWLAAPQSYSVTGQLLAILIGRWVCVLPVCRPLNASARSPPYP